MRTFIGRLLKYTGRGPSFFIQPKVSVSTSPIKSCSSPLRKYHQITFSEKPLISEKRGDYKARVQQNIATMLSNSGYDNHLLFMSYATRIARKDETLENAAKLFGIKKMTAIDLCFVEKYILPGHCLLAFIGAKGRIEQEHTFSLRPNMKEKSWYKAPTAPDERLPINLTNEGTYVRPSIHTSLHQEIDSWANDAFYAWFVHPERRIYELNFILKPLDLKEQNKYFKAVKNLKYACQWYSLLDHFHKYTGETLGDIVSSQNCTSLFRLFETLNSSSFDLKRKLGDNPTPQLVRKVVNDHYFQYQTKELQKSEEVTIEVDDDELCRPFRRLTTLDY